MERVPSRLPAPHPQAHGAGAGNLGQEIFTGHPGRVGNLNFIGVARLPDQGSQTKFVHVPVHPVEFPSRIHPSQKDWQ